MSEELSLDPRNPKKPMSNEQLKSYFQKDYIVHNFNLEATNAVSNWFSEIKNKPLPPLVVYGKCGNGKTHLIFNHLISYKEKNPIMNIYWWQAEQVISKKMDFKLPLNSGVVFLETVLDQVIFKQATELVVEYCAFNKMPLIISDASCELTQNLDDVDYVTINEPTQDFYDFFSMQYKTNHPNVIFRNLSGFISVRHLENELRRDVLAQELNVTIE